MAISVPSDISGLVADWNADSLVLADNAAVASWTDDTSSLVLTTPDTDGVYDDGSDYPHGHASVVMSDARLQVSDAALNLATPTYVLIGKWVHDYLDNDWLFNKAASSAATLGIRMLKSTDGGGGELQGGYRDTAATFYSFLSSFYRPEQAVLLGMLQDGTKAQLFVNGEVVATDTRTVTLDSSPTGVFSVGGHPSVATNSMTKSRLFRVLVWNKALSSTEWADLYNWYLSEYPPRYTRESSTAIVGSNTSSPSAWLDGSTYHIFVTDEANDDFDYYTAPDSDPSNWTLQQASAYSPTAATRGSCIVKEGSTWYLFYDDRTSGHIEYASGSSLTTLTHQAQLFTASAGKYYRHPAVVPPAKSHDGDWQLLLDIRTDSATGRFGHIIAASGASLGALVEDGTVISASGADDWYNTDVGSPSVKVVSGTYYCALAGFNDDELWSGRAPHAVGIWTSTDFATWTPYEDNPVLAAANVSGAFDANGAHEPEILDDLSLFYSGFDDTSPTQVSGTGYATLTSAGTVNTTLKQASGFSMLNWTRLPGVYPDGAGM